MISTRDCVVDGEDSRRLQLHCMTNDVPNRARGLSMSLLGSMVLTLRLGVF